MKSWFWWDTGWWLVAVPSLGPSFYRALNRASTHVFLERLALTFRLIITHNQQLCSHYFSTFFFFFLIQTCRFFLFSVFCLCTAYVRANKSPNGNHYIFSYISVCLLSAAVPCEASFCVHLMEILFKWLYSVRGACLFNSGGSGWIKPLTLLDLKMVNQPICHKW